MLMGDERPSPARRSFVEGLTGSSGLGPNGPGPYDTGLVDYLPGGQILAIDEAARDADPQSAALAVMPLPAARSLRMAKKLKPDDLLREAVGNTKGAAVEDDGLRMALQRFQKPEQHGEESVRTGVFYLPDGSPNAKHYRNQKGSGTYGGTDKIEGETLFRNPLVVKGATGGKVPEEAYKTLTSVNDLKTLQKDVFDNIPPYYLKDPGLQAELVQRFMEKHAPDQANDEFIWNLIQNSQGGNRMRYALQELAIANKARDAGHDGIVGIGRSKNGPALSEAFDVRESHYPTPDGGFQLMPQFEEMLPEDAATRNELLRRALMR